MAERPTSVTSNIKQANQSKRSRRAKLGKNFIPRGADVGADWRRHSLALNQEQMQADHSDEGQWQDDDMPGKKAIERVDRHVVPTAQDFQQPVA